MAEIIESRFHQMLQTAFGPDMMRYFDDPDVIEIMLNDYFSNVTRFCHSNEYRNLNIK